MKLIIAGSRTLDPDTVYDTLVEFFGVNDKLYNSITEVVSGTAKGVDTVGELFAFNADWPVKQFPANWTKNGKAAGYIRNAKMADYADALLLIWDGVSKGSGHMKRLAEREGLTIYEIVLDKSKT
jgi:hypothetical protein